MPVDSRTGGGSAQPLALALPPEPPGDEVTVSSHVVVKSLPSVDVPAAAVLTVTLIVPQPTFPPETWSVLSTACEILESNPMRGVSFNSTTVDSLPALPEHDGPDSNVVFGSLEKCMKFWNFEGGGGGGGGAASERFELEGMGGRGAAGTGAADGGGGGVN